MKGGNYLHSQQQRTTEITATNFDASVELNKRVESATKILHQLSNDSEQLEREIVYYNQMNELGYNRLYQTWMDKKSARSSEEERRKLLADLKARVSSAQNENLFIGNENKRIENGISLINGCIKQCKQNDETKIREVLLAKKRHIMDQIE